MKKVILSVLTASLFVISCQKDDDPSPIPPPDPVKYMTLSAGSTWNYELVNNGTPASTTTFTLTSTSRDSTINGKSYHVLTNSSGSANEYYFIAGNDYYNFRKLPSALGGANVEYLYLKDNTAAGTNWSQTFPVTYSGITLDAVLTNTITEKGLTKIVKGITYSDVIRVTTTVAIAGVPASALTTDIQSFYAGKFGMIESINKISLDYAGVKDNTDQHTSLVTADIK
ncbi:MAG: hypothetical protein ABIQ31_08055 [Ferruginibacter sp.]